jgi:acyl-CoA hydrolase
VNLGTPLGLGKANHIVNEFFRRASADPHLDLRIFTALTLAKPVWKNDIERRLVEPLAERLFGGYPALEYVEPLRTGKLPDNIRVNEFYFQPGALLGSPLAQQEYTSSNYSHVVRDVMDAGINVLAQLVGKAQDDGATRYSLSCNPDLTLDLVPRMRQRGEKFFMLGQVNRNLPFMYGDADVGAEFFDAIVDNPKLDFPLFGTPNYPVGTAEYMIALYVSALIRDGGTLQVGIGALGDAITALLGLRHERNDVYRELLGDARVLDHFGPAVERIGGTDPFEEGLFAATEMLVAGFLELYRKGILKRKVYGHAAVQRLLNEKRISENVTPAMLETFVDAGIIAARLSADDCELLKKLGVMKPDVAFEAGQLRVTGETIPADLGDRHAAAEIHRRCLGTRLKGGYLAQSSFFLGPGSFYEALRAMDRSEREQICMTGISYVNELYGHEELKRLQRKDARFVNTGLIATLTGAVASDALEDGRVLSGVGGQYNFVAMAHALEDGRSILMIRSTHEEHGRVQSNIRWSYGNITIPRHLRDFIVTEYGIADLRGRTDEEVATALIQIADSRFQQQLLDHAKRAGKVSADYEIPERFRSNRPDRLEKTLAPYRARGGGLFAEFPFGTDLTKEEIVLSKALRALKQRVERKKLPLGAGELRKVASVPETARPYLERMSLDAPRTLREKVLRRVIVYALASVHAI